ncbi:universal stress protein [Plantactinospora sp. GCM10030261]|uniref:universal stress protein n=1 Tax=Plantactinospora sp. GCM10030261 TaxID=3273420 RepID=UPI003618DFCB
MTVRYVILVFLVWFVVGLVTAAVFVTRGGHRSGYWYLLGGLLGPLFVPIAVSRGAVRTGQVEVRSRPGDSATSREGLKVLVGLDGSADSDRALRAVANALAGTTSLLVLATVIDEDLVGPDAEAERQRARSMLDARVARLPAGLPEPVTEILTGPPVEALLAAADSRDVDLLVVGRHGHGLRERLLGGVAEKLAYQSSRAVLLGSLPDRR